MKSPYYPPGTRVRYQTYPEGQQMASLGMKDAVMQLNARQYVSGVILVDTPRHYRDSLYFRPDGWPLPRDIPPYGCLLETRRMQPYDGPDLIAPIVHPGTLKPVTPEEIQRLVDRRIQKYRKE